MRAILTYHSIDSSGSPISLSPATFTRHVRWLRSGRVRVLGVEALIATPDEEDAVAVTFDDGFANFGEVAAPRLADAGVPSTLFVVSDQVGRTNAWNGVVTKGIPDLPLLGWPALGHLAEQGVVIGAHTRTHPDLTTLDASRAREEMRGAADVIERELGRRPAIFAYPYGALNASLAEAASAEFRWSCTTEFALLARDVTRARLPRLDAYYFQDVGRLDAFGTPAFARYVSRRRAARRVRRWLGG
jgi:peptidoglycan/xylan/chitin deacetylase (PgdA/CDA1 family)